MSDEWSVDTAGCAAGGVGCPGRVTAGTYGAFAEYDLTVSMERPDLWFAGPHSSCQNSRKIQGEVVGMTRADEVADAGKAVSVPIHTVLALLAAAAGDDLEEPSTTIELLAGSGLSQAAARRIDHEVRQMRSTRSHPNGTVQLSDGTLVVAETVGGCLTGFSIDDGGDLTNRRVWADLSGAGLDGGRILPDGIGLGGADRIWVSDPSAGGAVLVEEGGRVLAAIRTSQSCFAVGLIDTQQGRTAVCCTAATSNPTTAASQRTGRLETVLVHDHGTRS